MRCCNELYGMASRHPVRISHLRTIDNRPYGICVVVSLHDAPQGRALLVRFYFFILLFANVTQKMTIQQSCAGQSFLYAYLYTLSILGFTISGEMSACATSPILTSLSVMSTVQWSSPILPTTGYLLLFIVIYILSFLRNDFNADKTERRLCSSR